MPGVPRHAVEYLLEALGLGLFMIAAVAAATLLEHPASPLRARLDDAVLRRALMGLAMGGTSIVLVYSSIGARSGGHFNPATTLMFYRLGRVAGVDLAGYAAAQVLGGLAGLAVARLLFAPWIADPAIRYVATSPGPWGEATAFAAETAMTFVLMSVVLRVSNDARWSRFTGLAAGALVALYITVEAPVSGMSLNPARSLAPSLATGEIHRFWIYLAAPPLGMLAAAELYVRRHGLAQVFCAKLHHHTAARCIFHCRVDALRGH
ncbi:MAG: aquaporin [Vicinamibacteraceae bacterium]